MNFYRSLSVFGSSKFLSTAIIFSIGVITARLLTPEGRGIYALFFMMVGLGANLSNLGLSQANTYFLNREKVDRGILIGNTAAFVLASCVGLGLLLLIARTSGFLTSIGFGSNLVWLGLLWLATFATVVDLSFAGLIYGSHLYTLQSKNLIIQAALLLGATILIIPTGSDVGTALALRSGAVALFSVWYVFSFWRHVRPFRMSVSIPTFVKQIKFGSRNWLQNLIGLLNYRGYILVLGALSGHEAIGLFSVSMLLVEAVRFFPDTIGTLLLPHLVKLKDDRDADEFAAQTCRLSLLITIPIALLLMVFADWIVPFVFGVEYLAAVATAQMLLIGAVMGTIYQVMTRYFTSIAKQKYSIFAACISLVVAIGSAFVLIPQYSAFGAAIAFSLSALASAIVMLISFLIQTRLPVSSAVFATRNDFSNIWNSIKSQIGLRL
ncbi:oligosaccharide flippase family protein [Rhodobacteraceae bacterium Araon29]